MNHDDIVYRGRVPEWVRIEGKRVVVPFEHEPTPEASWSDIEKLLVGPPVKPESWPEPAHAAFASLNVDDTKALADFVRTYGVLGEFFGRDESGKLAVDPEYVRRSQHMLQTLWGVFSKAMSVPGVLVGTERNLSVQIEEGVVRILAPDLDAFMMIGFLIDRAAGLTQVCEYEKCTRQKYFLKSRADQQFCSTQCRALHNRLLWRTDPKNVEREKKQRRKAARSKRKRVA